MEGGGLRSSRRPPSPPPPGVEALCADLGLESKGQKKDVVAMLSLAHTAAKAVMKDGLAAAADPSEGTGSASASATDAAAL